MIAKIILHRLQTTPPHLPLRHKPNQIIMQETIKCNCGQSICPHLLAQGFEQCPSCFSRQADPDDDRHSFLFCKFSCASCILEGNYSRDKVEKAIAVLNQHPGAGTYCFHSMGMYSDTRQPALRLAGNPPQKVKEWYKQYEMGRQIAEALAPQH